MSIHATLYDSQRGTDRGADRIDIDRSSTLRTDNNAPVDVRIENVSASGFRLRSPIKLTSGQAIRVGAPGIGIRGGQVMWTDQDSAGCMFDTSLTPAELATVLSFEGTVVEGAFALAGGFPEYVAPPSDLSERRRLAIILASALGAWVLFLGLIGLIRATVSIIQL